MSSEQITISFPDDSKREFDAGVTGYQVAESISKGLARNALSITFNGTILDLDRPLTTDGNIEINTWDSDDGKYAFWHSSAHLLAEAVQEFYPNAKFAIGPPIENGFYYDIDFGDKQVSEKELDKIQKKMIELARQKNNFVRSEVPKEKAITYFEEKGDPYKLELLEDLEDGTISFYEQGNFTDLCRGPHIQNTGLIKAVKLTSMSGAYWRGNSDNTMLTRIYGISFPKQKMLEEWMHQVEEAKKRDHKKLGKQMKIFMMDQMVGQGLPVWLPKGTKIRRILEQFLREEQVRRGYDEVITPHIGNLKLYETSGHYPYYKDSQYAPIDVDDEKYILKPMNCPHHHRIYDSDMRSYRDLPVRLAEFGTVYRYEQSGELNGLSRVRGFTQDDAHIYCTNDQLKQEIKNTIELTQFVFQTFDMPVDIRLSYRDDNDEKYGGNIEQWERAQKDIKEAVDEMGLSYKIVPGEASFYGPKIDFIIRDAIGRKWQLGTVQVDYVMPERFDLTYIGSDNQKHRPVIIHRAPFGSMERFMSILIEHFAGNFPLWLSPTQVSILPISEDFNEFGADLKTKLEEKGVRVYLNERDEQIGAKIRDSETQKTPYMLIVGEKEQSSNTVSVRRHTKGDIGTFQISDFISRVVKEIDDKALPTTY
jgi:threonyl-tRNA synthetase